MNLENITVESKDVPLNEASSAIFEFALREACSGYCYSSNNICSLFFTKNRLLKIWNLYPDLRSGILENVIMRSWSWKKSLTKEDCSQMVSNCITICEEIAKEMSDDLSPRWANVQDKLSSLGFLTVEHDFLENLEKLSDDQTGDNYLFWLNRYMDTLDSSNEQEFEDLYLSIKRAPGATEVRRTILKAALNKEALSEKILKKIVKSAPISLRRSIVDSLANQKTSCEHILYYQNESRRQWSVYGELDFAAAKEKAAKIESKLILFAPVQDKFIQERLINSLEKENLVWIVPAVSSLGKSWLTRELQRRMS